jgi:hypothetical protein
VKGADEAAPRIGIAGAGGIESQQPAQALALDGAVIGCLLYT